MFLRERVGLHRCFGNREHPCEHAHSRPDTPQDNSLLQCFVMHMICCMDRREMRKMRKLRVKMRSLSTHLLCRLRGTHSARLLVSLPACSAIDGASAYAPLRNAWMWPGRRIPIGVAHACTRYRDLAADRPSNGKKRIRTAAPPFLSTEGVNGSALESH